MKTLNQIKLDHYYIKNNEILHTDSDVNDIIKEWLQEHKQNQMINKAIFIEQLIEEL